MLMLLFICFVVWPHENATHEKADSAERTDRTQFSSVTSAYRYLVALGSQLADFRFPIVATRRRNQYLSTTLGERKTKNQDTTQSTEQCTDNISNQLEEHCGLNRTNPANIMASTIIYSILWLLLLIFIAWPISWFCAWWWVVLISFESLFPIIKQASEFLEKIVSWPRTVGSAMIKGDTQFPAPW